MARGRNNLEKKIGEFLDATYGLEDQGLPIVQRFIHEHPEAINERDPSQNTALILASIVGNLQIVDALLIAPGIDINARNIWGKTALLYAAYNKHFSVLRSLLRYPNVDIQTPLPYMDSRWPGYSALMLLAEFGEVETAKTLLAKMQWEDVCYTITYRNRQLTAEMIAREKRHFEILELICQRKMELASSLRPGVATFSERIDKLAEENLPVKINEKFICPISLGIMNDPVTVSSGVTYDRASLQLLFASKNYPSTVNCTLTRYPISVAELWYRTSIVFKNDLEDFVTAEEKSKLQNQLLQNNAKEEVELPANNRKRKGSSLKLFERHEKPEEAKRPRIAPDRYRP